jgi:hypothetical protein
MKKQQTEPKPIIDVTPTRDAEPPQHPAQESHAEADGANELRAEENRIESNARECIDVEGDTSAVASKIAKGKQQGAEEERTSETSSRSSKKRGRPPGSKNKTAATAKTPRKRRSKGAGGQEEDESFITLTQTLRRNTEKANKKKLERREAKEREKRKRQAPEEGTRTV